MSELEEEGVGRNVLVTRGGESVRGHGGSWRLQPQRGGHSALGVLLGCWALTPCPQLTTTVQAPRPWQEGGSALPRARAALLSPSTCQLLWAGGSLPAALQRTRLHLLSNDRDTHTQGRGP